MGHAVLSDATRTEEERSSLLPPRLPAALRVFDRTAVSTNGFVIPFNCQVPVVTLPPGANENGRPAILNRHASIRPLSSVGYVFILAFRTFAMVIDSHNLRNCDFRTMRDEIVNCERYTKIVYTRVSVVYRARSNIRCAVFPGNDCESGRLEMRFYEITVSRRKSILGTYRVCEQV